ncbi:MAG TPA: NAD-dependent succinate-semialdehyde dehydrogenase, partial [Sphingomicrobium sp.]|nr:NAD-dependent succinate-semialdehyde dehydrogenase [Sphingomicrobium sp.]
MINRKLNRTDLLIESAYIAGEWRGAGAGRTINVENPATGEIIGTIPDCDEIDTRTAIEAAARAFPSWRATTAAERSQILERWNALILENLEDLAQIMTAEQGKPLAEAQGEIRYAASFVKWFAEEARRVSGHEVPAPERNRRIFVRKEPIGVSAAITPWNFPAAMITRKCAPALAAGCPVVVKPSELTPYSALALVKLAEIAGIPPGVFNIVTGLPQAIGSELTSNATVRKLSFTGSTRVGALLMRQSADTIKKLSLELGGNAPLIVFDDADLDIAVASAMASKFRNAGQTCVCANRIMVQDGIHDEFASRLGKSVQALKVGPGHAPDVTTGPLINAAAVEKVHAHLDDALTHGAKTFAMAESVMDPERFVAPVVLTGASEKMRLASEETFGPVAPLFRFRDEQQAIELANSTPYGLASYFYTNDISRAFRVSERLETGMVGLNTGTLSMEV